MGAKFQPVLSIRRNEISDVRQLARYVQRGRVAAAFDFQHLQQTQRARAAVPHGLGGLAQHQI